MLSRLKATTRVLMSGVKRTNRSLSLGKKTSVNPNVAADRKTHATALKTLRKKMGRSDYLKHRLTVETNSKAMRKRNNTKSGYANW